MKNLLKQIILEEFIKIKEGNDSPTIAPSKPKIKPSTPGTPSKPKIRRPLTPPKTAPQTSPKAENMEKNIAMPGDEGYDSNIAYIVDVIEMALENPNPQAIQKALQLVKRLKAELRQAPSGLQEDEKQIAGEIAKRFLSKKK